MPVYNLDSENYRKEKSVELAREIYELSKISFIDASKKQGGIILACHAVIINALSEMIAESDIADDLIRILADERLIDQPPIDWEKTHEAQKSDRDDLDYELSRDREDLAASRLMLDNLGVTTPQPKGE